MKTIRWIKKKLSYKRRQSPISLEYYWCWPRWIIPAKKKRWSISILPCYNSYTQGAHVLLLVHSHSENIVADLVHHDYLLTCMWLISLIQSAPDKSSFVVFSQRFSLFKKFITWRSAGKYYNTISSNKMHIDWLIDWIQQITADEQHHISYPIYVFSLQPVQLWIMESNTQTLIY